MKVKITWEYRYVPEGQLEPDEFNRWGITGSIHVHHSALPEYKAVSDALKLEYLPIPIAYIHQKGTIPGRVPSVIDQFCCEIFSADDCGNYGIGKRNVFGNTPEEVQEKAQKELDKVFLIFKNLEYDESHNSD